MIPDDKGLSGVNQELTGVNQGIPVSPGVDQGNPVLPVVSGEHKISVESHAVPGVKPRGGMGFNSSARRFDWQKKRRFLRMAKRFWPNVTLCCAACGISDSTFYTHRKIDPIFAHKVAEIDRGTTDNIEGVLAEQATKPESFLDRMAYLRAHRPELYNPAKVVKIEGYKMTQSERGERLAGLEGAIDAQIVSAYTTRKERLQQQREKRGELPSGDTQGKGE